MAEVAFALPVKSAEAGRKFVEEMTTKRGDELHQQRKSHGFKAIKVWRQHTPQEMVIVYLQADNLEQAMGARNASDHAFENWFEQMYQEVTGVHPDTISGPPSEILMDWHHETGHKKKGAPA